MRNYLYFAYLLLNTQFSVGADSISARFNSLFYPKISVGYSHPSRAARRFTLKENPVFKGLNLSFENRVFIFAKNCMPKITNAFGTENPFPAIIIMN